MKPALLILLVTIAISSCCTKKTTTDTQYIETRTTLLRDTVIRPMHLQTSFSIKDVERFPVNRWIVLPDTAANGEIRILMDSLGKLYVECHGKDHIIQQLRSENSELRSTHTEVREVSDQGIFSQLKELLHWGLTALVVVFLGGIMYRYLLPLFARR